MPSKRKPRASGPAIPEAERRERGQERVNVRLDAELVAAMDAACERHGLLRPALIRTALEDWLAAEATRATAKR